VACAIVALEEDGAELVGAGDVCALVARGGGGTEHMASGAPAAGERTDHTYESKSVSLGNRDKAILLSHASPNVAGLVSSVVTVGYTSSSRDALNKLFARLGREDSTGGGNDLTGAVIARTG
jgi:hypothetical protein